MDERNMLMISGAAQKVAAQEALACNVRTQRFGLALTQAEAAMLAHSHAGALKRSGRVEFGGGALQALILAFCDSPYLPREGYVETLCVLTEIFCVFKTDAEDEVDDAETVALMRRHYDECRGSLELLEDRMTAAARSVRFGDAPEDAEEAPEPMWEEEADE